jgi:hypothetical protein
MSPEMPAAAGYDPKIIERFADQLLRKADTVRVGCAVGGGIFGVFVGAVPLTPLRSVWGVPASFGVATIIVGALLGILIGYVVGEGRAFRYRVQAQSAIFQLEIERRVSAAVTEAVAGVAAPPAMPAPAAEPTPAPVAEPAQPPVAEPAPPPVAEPAPPSPVSPPPLSPVVEPARPVQALLRPPEPVLPPVSPRPEEPPLSPAANG